MGRTFDIAQVRVEEQKYVRPVVEQLEPQEEIEFIGRTKKKKSALFEVFFVIIGILCISGAILAPSKSTITYAVLFVLAFLVRALLITTVWIVTSKRIFVYSLQLKTKPPVPKPVKLREAEPDLEVRKFIQDMMSPDEHIVLLKELEPPKLFAPPIVMRPLIGFLMLLPFYFLPDIETTCIAAFGLLLIISTPLLLFNKGKNSLFAVATNKRYFHVSKFSNKKKTQLRPLLGKNTVVHLEKIHPNIIK